MSKNSGFHAESGFMGITHALSALAAALVLIAFFPAYLSDYIHTPWLALALVLTFIGATMLPDADNTDARIISDLGIAGRALSLFFRTTSVFLQTTLRAKRDDPTPNPHRGFWHTTVAAILLGWVVYLISTIPGSFRLPLLGDMTTGRVIVVFLMAVMTHLAYSSVLKKAFDKIKKSSSLGEVVAAAVSLSTVLLCLSQASTLEIENLGWLVGRVVALGMTLHIIGDMFTIYGAPAFFPLTAITRKKFWWTTSLLPIHAGGPIEKYVIAPAFVLVILISAVFILPL